MQGTTLLEVIHHTMYISTPSCVSHPPTPTTTCALASNTCTLAQVRQEGRAALQQALWERAEGRFRARTVGPMAANLSSILMADLDMVRGKQVPYATAGEYSKGQDQRRCQDAMGGRGAASTTEQYWQHARGMALPR